MASARQIGEQLRKRQVAGLLTLLAIILVISIYRAGVPRVFPAGWWRFW